MSGESLRVITLRAVSSVDRGLERRQFFEALPAIVEGDPRLGLEAAAGIGLRAAAAPPLAIDRDRKLGKRRVAPAGSEGAVTGGCLRA